VQHAGATALASCRKPINRESCNGRRQVHAAIRLDDDYWDACGASLRACRGRVLCMFPLRTCLHRAGTGCNGQQGSTRRAAVPPSDPPPPALPPSAAARLAGELPEHPMPAVVLPPLVPPAPVAVPAPAPALLPRKGSHRHGTTRASPT
jgi:hypothetical protein